MVITFKSNPKNWEKERDGRKPNTFRKFDSVDGRHCKLLYASNDEASNYDGLIAIENTETKEIFTRKITDITFWDGYFIVSWKHE